MLLLRAKLSFTCDQLMFCTIFSMIISSELCYWCMYKNEINNQYLLKYVCVLRLHFLALEIPLWEVRETKSYLYDAEICAGFIVHSVNEPFCGMACDDHFGMLYLVLVATCRPPSQLSWNFNYVLSLSWNFGLCPGVWLYYVVA